jgi:hypothetical protein
MESPQDLNRYSYVRGNPLVYIDPSGHKATREYAIWGGTDSSTPPNVVINWFKRNLGYWALAVDAPAMTEYPDGTRTPMPASADDLTAWLIDQMNTNGRSEATALMREHWSSRQPQRMAAAMAGWNALVRGGAIWDFKGDIKKAEYTNAYPDNFKIVGHTFRFDAFANIHYGFVGRAAGFPAGLLESGAGAAQWRQWRKKNPSLIGPWDTFFDQPYDNWCVALGIYLYDYMIALGLEELTLEVFEQGLQNFIDMHGTAQSWEDNNSSLE